MKKRDEKRVRLLNKLKKTLKELHQDYSIKELQQLTSTLLQTKEPLIPLNIFKTRTLSSLELIVTHLKDEQFLSYKDIAKKLGRKTTSIGNSYRTAKLKHKNMLERDDNKQTIPPNIFVNRQLSVLESIVTHLKEEKNLSLKNIAKTLHRDTRTIWTVYHRSLKKRGNT